MKSSYLFGVSVIVSGFCGVVGLEAHPLPNFGYDVRFCAEPDATCTTLDGVKCSVIDLNESGSVSCLFGIVMVIIALSSQSESIIWNALEEL